MAVAAVIGNPSGAINYTFTTDSIGDWSSVANGTYFYDKADKLVHFKDDSGAILELFTASGSSGGIKGVNAQLPLSSGDATTAQMTGGSFTSGAVSANRLLAYPFFPANNVVSSSLYINVTTLVSGSLCRILIYSDLNGKPNEKLYESVDLDCSTIGLKTATLSFAFNAGTINWLAFHSNSNPSIQLIPATTIVPIKTLNTNVTLSHYLQMVTFGSAPATWTSTSGTNTSVPLIGIVQV
jgi:hypothetical protein